jgi:NADP-dependent 3-hydroxy acid dehydrogenase YdfG
MSTAEHRPLALVTGASSGIGYELAKQFADNGFDLIIAAQDDELQTAKQELQATGLDAGNDCPRSRRPQSPDDQSSRSWATRSTR